MDAKLTERLVAVLERVERELAKRDAADDIIAEVRKRLPAVREGPATAPNPNPWGPFGTTVIGPTASWPSSDCPGVIPLTVGPVVAGGSR